jgi:hypothetical protein
VCWGEQEHGFAIDCFLLRMLKSLSMPHFHNFNFFFLLCYKLHPLLSQYLLSFLFSSSSQFSLHSYTIHFFYRRVQLISPIVKHTPTYTYTHLIASQPSWLIFSHGVGALGSGTNLESRLLYPQPLKEDSTPHWNNGLPPTSGR